jgi:hypothetical protein
MEIVLLEILQAVKDLAVIFFMSTPNRNVYSLPSRNVRFGGRKLRSQVKLRSMFRGSRAPWGRFEDRCDGAGSEADGAEPSVNRAIA